MSTSETIDGGPGGVAGEPTGVTIELDIQSAGPTEEFPATALQAGMFFHAEANPGTGVDIEQISIEFDEPLDLPRFLEAWATVFRRHRILGSTFAWDASGRPITTIGHPFSLPVRVEDWRGEAAPVDTQTAEAAAERLIDFDLANGPLHRLVVAELSNGRWWVLWTFHHAILDGRSFPLVLREIFDRYDDGPSAAATARPDVGRFLRVIAEQDHGDGPAFWRRLLAGFETPNTLTVDRLLHHDRAVPPVAVLEHELGHEETAALRALAGETGCSLNTCIQAAWFLLLAHHTQQDFVTFGTTRACRHSVADAQDMVGLLINTVPLGLAVDDDETVGGLLQRLRDAQRALRAHETMPLPDIIEAVDAGPTLFDSIVVYDDASLDARMRAAGVAGPAGAASRRFHYDGQTNFPLTLLAYGDESLSIRLEYATDRYDEGFAAELLAHLRNLLVGLPAGLDRPAGNIGYLTMAEQEQYTRWNLTEVDYDLDTTLHARFEVQAAATPDRPALIFGEDVLTYAEFNRLADQLAADLRRRGVGPDHFVGVFAERSFELMIAVYAIIKAGGAYVPLDPDHPADRLRFMADDAGLALILTQAHLADRLPTGAAEAVIVDVANWGWTADPAPQSDEPPADNAGPGNVAYLLYTSGSTGRPKGVMIEHRSIINRLRWMQDAFPLDGTDVVLQKTPYTFDVSVWELFWPLLEGASLVLAAPGDHRDPAALVRTIAANRVTTLHFVPSMLALFVEEPSVPQCETIRRVICSGEALPRALQDRLFAVLDTELHNLYGPTEAAVDVTWWACDPASPLDTVPIGYPIANTEVHVLDRRLRRVPRGTAGELCIGGVQVARGYHGRDELTADRFVPDPYRSTPGARLYRTGDLVRHHPDGAVEFLGRLDHQVKLHGQRIELGEIEAAIAAHDATREVVVTAAGAGTTEAVLVAYVVANGEPATLEAELREHCGRSLAAYMVPSIWMFLDEMPLNANGKADRKALPEPALIRSDRAIVDPASQLERDIVAVWEQVLETSPIGTTDTFFDVGGNSLLLVVLAQRLTERLGREVGVAELLRHTTVAAQAEHLRPSDDAGDDQAGPGSPDADAAVAAGRDRARARRARRRRTGG